LDPASDPDPAPARQWLPDANKNKFLSTFFADYFLKVHLHQFSKKKSQKEVIK
jgi:hypothetical protein